MTGRKLTAGVCAFAPTLSAVAPALAHDCFVAKEPATAAAVGMFDERGFAPLKPNPGTFDKPHGAFVAFSEGGESGSTFIRAPQGVLPPAREGGAQYNCDGKGVDAFSACG